MRGAAPRCGRDFVPSDFNISAIVAPVNLVSCLRVVLAATECKPKRSESLPNEIRRLLAVAKIKRMAKTGHILQKMQEQNINSQKQLAELSGVDEDTLTALLANTRGSLPETYKKLASALKVGDYKELFDATHVRIEKAHEKPSSSNVEGSFNEHALLTTTLVERVLGILTSPVVDVPAVNSYVESVAQFVRNALHDGLGWIDVMRHIGSITDGDGEPLLKSPGAGKHGWLKLEFSEIFRTGRPRLIPVAVSGKPWRGSGAAYLSGGVDYVDRMTSRLLPKDYDVTVEEAEQVSALYSEWENGHHFASLVAIAIPSRVKKHEPIGVLNLNFPSPAPFGAKNTLPPEVLKRVQHLLRPHLSVLAEALSRLPKQ